MLQAQQSLLEWFDMNHRILPWRSIAAPTLEPHDSDAWKAKSKPHLTAQEFAYRVWISEVMLQQTQVRLACCGRAASSLKSDCKRLSLCHEHSASNAKARHSMHKLHHKPAMASCAVQGCFYQNL